MSQQIDSIVEVLSELTDDTSVPQNIRRDAQEVTKALSNEAETIETRKNRAFQLLEGMVNDINIDMFTRTNLLNIVAMVEALKEGDT
jgi:uncharacterized protein (UPF0147 family)